MRIGLVSYRCKNRDVPFNLRQIERAMKQAEGKAELLCFGEAFLQGFDALCWAFDRDREMALALSSEPIDCLRSWTLQHGLSLAVGYIERDREKLYSSYVVLSQGKTVHNYRRISKGWKEYTLTDGHYCEGTDVTPFVLNGKEMTAALCGDLWDYPERFRTDRLLLWPVYVNYSIEEWSNGALEEYAAQAALAAKDVLMVNPIDAEPVNHGGAFRFQNGRTEDRLPFDREGILIVDIP
jgi:N-carbamoylputrescine amidase